MLLKNKLPFWIALNSYVEAIVSGVPPLSLPKAKAKPIKNLIAFGGTEQRNLPDDYIERQYIYMMDGSYLVSDITPEPDWHIEMDFQTTSVSTAGVRDYFGGRYDSSPAGAGIRLSHTSSKKVVLYGFDTNNAYTGSSYNMADNTRYKYVYNNGSASLSTGGTVVDSTTFTVNDTTTSAIGINSYRGPSGSYSSTTEGIYLYSFKAWNGQGELVMDLVPAVQKGTVPVVGFYDTVSETFMAATAGTFAAGGEAVPTPDTPMDIVSNNGVLKVRHQSGLPLGYTRLDYLQSDGASYLIVPYRVNNKTVFYCRYNEIQNGPQTANAIFGVTDTPDVLKANYGILRLTGGNFNRMGWGNSTLGSIIEVDAPKVFDTWYEILYDQNKLYQDGTLYATSATDPSTVWSANYGLGIFARNSSSVTMLVVAKISSVWAKEDGEYKVNLVPAKRNSDNVLGMYDLVSGQFLTNQGTGDFVAGTAVSDPVEIYTDGTVETINMHTRNLFSGIVEQGGLSDGTGSETTSSARIRTTAVPVKPNTTYNLSWVTNSELAVVIRNAHFYNASNTWLGRLNSATFTTPPDTAFVRFVWQHSDSISDITPSDISNVQLELGSTATTYEPYYDGGTAVAEMLLKISSDYQDQQEIIDGTVTRNVGVKVLDGSEEWEASTTFVGSCATASLGIPANVTVICSHAVCNNTSTYTYGQCKMAVKFSIWLSADTTTTTLKQWLADQYAAGTPVVIIYPLATPTTESVTGQTLQVTDGDNIAEITQASMSDLELSVKYKKGA